MATQETQEERDTEAVKNVPVDGQVLVHSSQIDGQQFSYRRSWTGKVGYDEVEVDDFLDDVAAQLKAYEAFVRLLVREGLTGGVDFLTLGGTKVAPDIASTPTKEDLVTTSTPETGQTFRVDSGKLYDEQENMIDLSDSKMGHLNRAIANSDKGSDLTRWEDGAYRLESDRFVQVGSGGTGGTTGS